MKCNVVSIKDRMEVWNTVYESPDGRLRVKASNHGRFNFTVGNSGAPVILDTVDSVGMLSRLSDGLETSLGVLFED